MKLTRLWGMLALALVAPGADAQPRPPAARPPAPIRVQSGGNELIAARTAPVRHRELEQLLAEIGRPDARAAAPIRVVRAAPPQMIDYVLCVTSAGTLVVGERVETFDERQRRYVFTRGGIARSYPPLEEGDGWLWLVEVRLSREAAVTLEMRAPARWPVDAVGVAVSRAP
jgi:hypothetical protein